MAHLLAERYELTALIGSGPTGEVWRARERGTREWLAVKLLDPHLSADPHTVDRFQRERHVLTAFLHLAYVRVRDLVAENRIVALVMELVDGTDLRTRLYRSGPVPPAEATDIAATVAEALAAAHDSGVVHCDVKPSNIIIEDDGGDVRVTDCRVGRLARGFRDGTVRYGYAEYPAPEVIQGGPPVPATDVYALGMLLFEMLTGTTPYRLDDPEPVFDWHEQGEPIGGANVPPVLRPVLRECLRAEPTIRPTAREVAAELRRLLPAIQLDPNAEPPLLPLPIPMGRERRHLAAPVSSARPAEDIPIVPPRREPARRPEPRPYSKNARIAVGAAAAALVAAAIVIAAIGMPAAGDGRSTGGPTGSGERRTPTGATGAPTAPLVPPDAVPATREGAVAFVTHWFNALSYAVSTGNTTALQAASSPSCRPCTSAATLVHNSYQSGNALRGGTYSLRNVTTDNFFNMSQPKIGVVFDRSPRSKVGPGGQLMDVFSPANFVACQVFLERSDNRWLVTDVQSNSPIA